jgi:TPR repeat protein
MRHVNTVIIAAVLALAVVTDQPWAQAPAPEVEAWNKIRLSRKAVDFENYLARFPRGRYAAFARARAHSLAAATPPAASKAGRLCDRLAAAPEDEGLSGAGVALYLIDLNRAETACREATTAAQGTARYHFNLARILYRKLGFADALFAAREAARLGHAGAMIWLGQVHVKPLAGFKRDDRAAHDWYLKAARRGSPRAMRQVANDYYWGRGVARDPAQGLAWLERRYAALQRLANKGLHQAIYDLGLALTAGDGVTKDPDKGHRILARLADVGHLQAISTLAFRYRSGRDGLPRDAKRAQFWFDRRLELLRARAAAGDIPAAYSLGTSYQFGFGVKRNAAEALKWHLQAANKGHEGAMDSLNFLYRYARGLKKNPSQARAWAQRRLGWTQKAAGEGDGHALYMIARGFANGVFGAKGRLRDAAKTIETANQAIAKGSALAHGILAQVAQYGALFGRQTDLSAAFRHVLAEARANQYQTYGTWQAVEFLAKGKGVTRNPRRAAQLAIRYAVLDAKLTDYDKRMLRTRLPKPARMELERIIAKAGFYRGPVTGAVNDQALAGLVRYGATDF